MNNVFLVHTEYHLMMTIRMIVTCFNSDNNYVYYTVGRLKSEISLKENYYNIFFKQLPSDNYGVRSTFDNMLSIQPSHFYLFQDNSSDNIYLMYHFHKRKINVSLVQDGYKPYPIWHRKLLPLVVVKETFEFYFQMFKRRALIPSLFLRSYKYGSLRYIDNLWLEFPNKLPYKTDKQLVQIPGFTKEALSLCFLLFAYNPDVVFENVILYIGQPFRQIELRNRELIIIKQILQKNTDKKFIYRPHPLVSKEQLSDIIAIDGVSVYDKAIPIELLMLYMKNSIIISPWSTALLTNNISCRYYWLHKLLFQDEGFSSIKQIEIVNPTNHIREVANIDEIV